jgi:hypothetical protein
MVNANKKDPYILKEILNKEYSLKLNSILFSFRNASDLISF